MQGTTLGPYHLLAELGSGGMGTVWKAAGADGAAVAVKVVHPHLLKTAGFRERFEREARLGMAITHENVVRTFACLDAERDGQRVPALVLEYVEGRSLHDLLRETGRVPEDLCRHLGQEIASGLSAIHAAGIVHRDLKPGNVLVTPDHRVKVMDLGLARQASGEDRLSATGTFVGTAAYAPPEQFLGKRELDPRSDLWSLGAMLYELATGRVPFDGTSIGEIVRKVLHDAPLRPGRIAPQISPFFEELVLTLLRKSPEGRPESAALLAAILRDGERGAWWLNAATRVVAETRRPLRRIRIPRESEVWGRDADLADLGARWAKAAAGDGQVVLLEGEAGIGKSRLVDEFLAGLDPEQVHVLVGEYAPGGGASGFATAFREHFRRDEDEIRRALADTPLLVAAFAAHLRGDGVPKGAEPLTPQSLPTVFVHATRAIAAEKPLVVLIEDLHFAPDEGRALFTALAHAVPGHRVLLLGTARPGLPASWYAEMERREHVAKREVRRLDSATVESHLSKLLGATPTAERLASRIASKAGGNPFFVFEMLRTLRESGVVSRADDGRWSVVRDAADLQIPSSVGDLVAGRLAGLGADDREILEAAACQGVDFDGRLVAEALGRPRLDVLRRLGRLERETALVRAAGPRFAFDHHLVHEVLYGTIAPALREELHAATAYAIERQHGAAAKEPKDLPGEVCVELAEHFLKGACGDRAARYIDAALTHLDRSYMNEAAIGLADLALSAPGLSSGRERAEILLRKQDRLEFLGRNDERYAVLTEALRLADESGDASLRARVRVRLGSFHRLHRRKEVSRTLLEEAQRIAHDAHDAKTEAAAEGSLGELFASEARHETARRHFERQLALAQERGDLAEEAGASIEIARVCSSLDEKARAREWVDRGLTLARQSGDRLAESRATGLLASILEREDQPDLARSHRERTLAIAREIGHRAAEAGALVALGIAGRGQSPSLETIELFERSLALWREMGVRPMEAGSSMRIAEACYAAGRLAEAQAHFEHALDLMSEGPDARERTRVAGYVRNLAAMRVQAPAAVADWQRRITRAADARDRWGECFAAGVLGRMHANAGRLADARTEFERSLRAADGAADPRLEVAVLLDFAELERVLGLLREARARLGRALAIAWREHDAQGQSAALRLVARVSEEEGDLVAAEREFDEAARRWGGSHGWPGIALLARFARFDDVRGSLCGPHAELETPEDELLRWTWYARLPGGDTAASIRGAEEALAAHEGSVVPRVRMEVRFLLWEASHDAAHLAEAKRLLDFFVEHAPPECRESMGANVRLHREIAAAARDAGAPRSR